MPIQFFSHQEYCCEWLTLRPKGFRSDPRPPDQSQMWNCYYRTLRRNRPPFLP
ncbi:hypothetical protein ES332_A11G135800v1 [Gossypium tomentosum]|uniref:Uncharacterized protein n=1 Tax=Gossypium tomentosum TaxID=34277 RepID=A0A5D2NAB1_GOSTO|nr:hypothetical protein ES332_A11G135800v1 [Gossypium tomentosum]